MKELISSFKEEVYTYDTVSDYFKHYADMIHNGWDEEEIIKTKNDDKLIKITVRYIRNY